MFSLIFALLFSSPLFASMPNLQGEFSFQGVVRAEVKMDYINVPVYNEKHREYLNTLIKKGYNCQIIRSTMYQCRRSEAIASFPENILHRINANHSGLKLEFAEGTFSRELRYSGDSYEEWIVYQPVTVDGKIFPNYRLMLLSNLVKVVINNPEATEYWSFVFIDQEHLEYMVDVSQSHSKGWTNYVGFIGVSR